MIEILLCALGHLVRDGTPRLGSTHAARAIGGLLCLGAGMAHSGVWGILFGLAIWLGFYLDQKHGEGQEAKRFIDVFYLSLSGTTSLALTAIALWQWWYVLLGLAKVPIWFGCWRLFSWYPTRIAATLFGAVVGLGLWLT